MTNTKFNYCDVSKAEEDIVLFSEMSVNEDKVLYLICESENTFFISKTDVDKVIAIGLNGVLYKPS